MSCGRLLVVGLLVWVAAGCVTSNATRCGDLVCPNGTTCAPSGDRCVDTDLVEACHGGDDGATCSVAGMPPATCLGGICQASRCGDGRVTGVEECDGNKLSGKTCQMLGFYERAGLGCTEDCKYDTSRCVGKCGDGIKNGNEQCDGADLGGATCFAAGYYAAAGLGCKANCKFDTAKCTGGKCGDGVINGLKEQCDGTKFSTTCRDMGFNGAQSGLACSNSCTFSSKSCLCAPGVRCTAKTQHCECSKFGCGCVANQQ